MYKDSWNIKYKEINSKILIFKELKSVISSFGLY